MADDGGDDAQQQAVPSLVQGRSRRQPVVSAGRAGARSALEALKAAREQGASKRVADYQVKQEKAVYDVLDEAEYVKLVTKRREEGGDFIVDDDGRGYADLGEEDHHWRSGRGARSDDEDEGEGEDSDGEEGGRGNNKKRKGGKGADAGKARKKGGKGGAADTAAAAAGHGNIAKMFSKAAARAALSAPLRPTAQASATSLADSDALLADILGGIGGPSGGAPAAAPHVAVAPPLAPPALVPAAPRPLAAPGGLAVGGRARGGRGPMGSVAAAVRPAARLAAAPLARPLTALPPAIKKEPLHQHQQEQEEEEEEEEDAGYVVQNGDDEDDDGGAAPAAMAVDGDEEEERIEPPAKVAKRAAAPSAAAAAAAPVKREPSAAAASSPPAPKPAAAAAKPAHPPGVGALVQERSQAAATGWASMYASTAAAPDDDDDNEPPAATDTNAPAAAAAAATPPSAAPAPPADGSSSPAAGPVPAGLPEGAVPFYYLDAYENADARPGEVFLFGKVPLLQPLPDAAASSAAPQQQQPAKWASACVVVKDLQRSVLVAPRPSVFEDGDGSIALLEAQAAAAAKEAAQAQAEAGRREAEAQRYAGLLSGAVGGAGGAGGAEQKERQEEEWRAREGEARAAAAGAAARAGEAAAKAQATRVSLLRLLQERCGELKAELRQLLARAGVRSFRLVPVKRWYAFENPDVPRGEQWCIKIRYPASQPTLSPHLSGRHFVALFGAATPCIESLLVKRKVKGPCWLVLSAPQLVEYCNQVSWCKVEMHLPSSKGILADPGHPAIANRPAPPLTVASLNLKTVIHAGTQQHEVVAAAVVYLQDFVDIEAPMTPDQWSKPKVLRNFCVVRPLDGHAWPVGFKEAAEAENRGARGRANGGNMVVVQPSERQLLTALLARLQVLDADVLVGHNISAFDLSVLLTRMQHHKVPLWSRIGRLKRSVWPKLTGGGHAYGGGASAGVLSAVAGRVLCDTYLSARELVREVDFTLRTLSASLLGQERGDLTSSDVPKCYQSTQGLLGLLRHAEGDAWLSLGLMFHLSVLPLTRALTALSGFLWSKTLQGARAQRIEMLLLHEFHARKYIMPDKTFGARGDAGAGGGAGAKGTKRKAAAAPARADGPAGEEGEDGPDVVALDGDGDDGPDHDGGGGGGKAGKKGPSSSRAGGKGPQYAGGLVLEPKKGLYDKLVIMLDFNSLYPSIIQEYNICFSTVSRPPDGSLPPLPPSPAPGAGLAPLPTILQGLVQRRRQVKSAMSSARDPVLKQQLNIRQQALKLTANSMYGCLGFTSSRFYAKPLAELITAQGRSILQSTVDLVQGSLGAEVIYGDTDSIMINTGSTDLAVARELGQRIKKEVNKKYKLLEIELDGIFKCMLLLKKKKYAAIKLEPGGPNNTLVEVQEQKGLDIVRRDWCALSKDAGRAVLSAVLSCRPCEEVVEDIHEHLRGVREVVASGTVPLAKFVITKQLTKRPEEYADARSQPHVQVALRRRAAGKRDGVLAGEAVPYVICVERGKDSDAAAATGGAAATQDGSQAGGAQAVADASGPPGTPAPAGGAAGATTPAARGGVVAAASTPASAVAPASQAPAASGAMGLAERAYHPEELTESGGRLVLDVDYYLGQQVHPVVSRLVSVLEGTDAARLAECLGLDPSRYRGQGSGGSGRSGAGGVDLQDMFGAGLLEDDSLYQACDALVLTAPGPERSRFEFRGALDVVLGRVSADQLLCPPDAVGDPERTLSAAQLANQVLLCAREHVARYYDGWLDADDELAQAAHDAANNNANHHAGALAAAAAASTPLPSRAAAAGGAGATPGGATPGQAPVAGGAAGVGGHRDVVLRPCGEPDRCPHPDATQRQAGVLLARRMDERQLYLQLSHYCRLINPDLAVKRGLARIRAQDPRAVVTEAELQARLAPVAPALHAAHQALERLRAQSAYHWVDLTHLLAPLQAQAQQPAQGAADGAKRQAAGQREPKAAVPLASFA